MDRFPSICSIDALVVSSRAPRHLLQEEEEKIPVNPDYILKNDDDGILLKNYEGETYHYPSKQGSLSKNTFLIP